MTLRYRGPFRLALRKSGLEKRWFRKAALEKLDFGKVRFRKQSFRMGCFRKGNAMSIKDQDREYAESCSLEELEEIMWDGVATTYDGCRVEPDGYCPHGYHSPLLVLGYI